MTFPSIHRDRSLTGHHATHTLPCSSLFLVISTELCMRQGNYRHALALVPIVGIETADNDDDEHQGPLRNASVAGVPHSQQSSASEIYMRLDASDTVLDESLPTPPSEFVVHPSLRQRLLPSRNAVVSAEEAMLRQVYTFNVTSTDRCYLLVLRLLQCCCLSLDFEAAAQCLPFLWR